MTADERRAAEHRSIERFTKGTLKQIKDENAEKKPVKKQTKGAK